MAIPCYLGLYFEHNSLYVFRGTHRVMDVVIGNGLGDVSSNPGKTFGISHCTNTLEKGMNPTLSLALSCRAEWAL